MQSRSARRQPKILSATETNQEKVTEKQRTDRLGKHGRESGQANDHLLDGHHVRLGNMRQPEPAQADPQQQEQREVVVEQRDLAHLGLEQPSDEQVRQGQQKEHRGHVEHRHPHFEESVQLF